jgi:hypothetical protein
VKRKICEIGYHLCFWLLEMSFFFITKLLKYIVKLIPLINRFQKVAYSDLRYHTYNSEFEEQTNSMLSLTELTEMTIYAAQHKN